MTLLRFWKYFLIHVLFTFIYGVCIVTSTFLLNTISLYMDPAIAQKQLWLHLGFQYYIEIILWYSFVWILLFVVSVLWLYLLAFKYFKYLKYYWCLLIITLIIALIYISALPDFDRNYDEAFFYQADNKQYIPNEQNIHYYLFLLFHEDSLSQRHPIIYKLYNKQNDNIDPQILKTIEDLRLSNFYHNEFSVDQYSYYICTKINANFCKNLPENIETRVQQPDIESIKKLNDFIIYVNKNTVGYQTISRDFFYWNWKIKNLFYQGLYYSLYEIEKWNIEVWMEIYKQYYIFFHNFSQADALPILIMSNHYQDKYFTLWEEILNIYSIDLKYFDFYKKFQINSDKMMKNFIISEYLDIKNMLSNSWVEWLENRVIDYSDLMEKYKWYLYSKYISKENKSDSRDFYQKNFFWYMLKYNSLWYYLYFTGKIEFSWYREEFQKLEKKRLHFIQKYLNK